MEPFCLCMHGQLNTSTANTIPSFALAKWELYNKKLTQPNMPLQCKSHRFEQRHMQRVTIWTRFILLSRTFFDLTSDTKLQNVSILWDFSLFLFFIGRGIPVVNVIRHTQEVLPFTGRSPEDSYTIYRCCHRKTSTSTRPNNCDNCHKIPPKQKRPFLGVMVSFLKGKTSLIINLAVRCLPRCPARGILHPHGKKNRWLVLLPAIMQRFCQHQDSDARSRVTGVLQNTRWRFCVKIESISNQAWRVFSCSM